ncbi:MAG: acetyl-CoA carboxylase biotin carboxyl carrier protein subunit, partial [Desulfobacterium sp.]|nr:acetyl-CoA carboxylase biotin carboxyl carrier protein subunit [Desulfobacterium sp.]
DPVEKGDPVVVVSAMKMETTLTAPHGGTVTRIGVKQGDKVMPGDILVDIEKGIENDEQNNPDKEES